MVLITASEEEHNHQRLVIACGRSPPGVAQTSEMDNASDVSMTSTSPSSHHSPSSMEPVEDEESTNRDLRPSPLLNGSAPSDVREAVRKSSPPVLSPCQKASVKKEEEEEDLHQLVVQHKQEQELDAPLDFSIKRKDSDFDSFREGHLSSWHSPHTFAPSPSSRLSPDKSLQQGDIPGGRQYTNSSSSSSSHEDWDEDPSRSPSPSSQPLPAAAPSKLMAKKTPGSAVQGMMNLLSEEVAALNPTALHALLAQKGAMAHGTLSALPSLLEEARKLQAASGGKVQRPFKAYPKEVLRMPLGYLGLPGVSPFPLMDAGIVQGLGVMPDDLVTAYQQQGESQKERQKQLKNAIGKKSSRSPPSPSTNGKGQSSHATPPPSSVSQPQQFPVLGSHSPSQGPTEEPQASSSPPAQALTLSLAAVNQGSDSAPSTLPSSKVAPLVSSTSSASTGGGSRKRSRNMPDMEKDDAYWERRRKNNDAAKRSRDARRAKEDEIALRAALLEQENLRLRVEVATLKTETARLRCLLYKT